MNFKNDKERLAFLDDYRNTSAGWYLWYAIEEIQRRWWKFDFDNFSIIVEEQKRTYNWPEHHEAWTVVHWYITDGNDNPFGDYVASRTMALARLKELNRKGKSQ